jgi:hypothetical protein
MMLSKHPLGQYPETGLHLPLKGMLSSVVPILLTEPGCVERKSKTRPPFTHGLEPATVDADCLEIELQLQGICSPCLKAKQPV